MSTLCRVTVRFKAIRRIDQMSIFRTCPEFQLRASMYINLGMGLQSSSVLLEDEKIK